MAVGDLFKYAQRALFSKPTPERQLLKLVKGQPIRRVVELGVDSIETTVRLLATLDKQARGEALHYAALDPFDERPAGQEPLSLADSYRQLVASGARLRMTPGTLESSIATQANSLADTDLLLLGPSATDASIGHAWFYLPRMCHPGTLVLRKQPPVSVEEAGEWVPMALEEVATRAGASDRRLAA